MWNIKHEISSPKLYELLIKTELKGDTPLDPKNFYNCIKMCLNAVTRIQEYLLHPYQSIKRHSEFENTSSQIVITHLIIGIFRYKILLDTNCKWQ